MKPRIPSNGRRRGAAMVFIAVSITGLFGLMSLGIDQGMMWYAKQRAQNVADAAAFAAAQGLQGANGSTATATSDGDTVINVANQSGSAFKSKTGTYVTFPTSVTDDSGTQYSFTAGTCVRVDGYVNAPVAFGSAVGYYPSAYDGTKGMVSVPAHAIVVIEYMNSGQSVLPFGAVADQPNSSDPTLAYIGSLLTNPPQIGVYDPTDTILKADVMSGSSIVSPGNFGAVALTGNGASDYRTDIGTPETTTISIGESIDTKTGNMVGPTQQGVSDRLASTNTAFTHRYTNYNDWFFGLSADPVTGQAYANLGTVTTSDGVTHTVYADPDKQETSDAHVGIIPLITSPDKPGKSSVTVLGFAVVFLDTTTSGDASSIVSGHFIGIMVPGTNSTGTTTTGDGGGAMIEHILQ